MVYREKFSVFRVVSEVKSLATFSLVGNIPYIPPGLTFKIHNSAHRVHVRFFRDLKTNSDYFPYSINWLGFKTEKERAYSAVRTEYSSI